ncbi:unnamed protein product, partial [Tetraodon nigroviridis]
ESSFPRWCLDLPAASSWAPSVQSSTWTPSSSTPVSPDVGSASFALLRPQPVDFLPPSPQVNWASLRMTRGGSGPGGSASCCAVPYSSARLSSCSASLTPCRPGRKKEEGADSEHAMLPPPLSSDCETPSASNGILRSHGACQQPHLLSAAQSDPQGDEAPPVQPGVHLHHPGCLYGDRGRGGLRGLSGEVPGAAVQPDHHLSQSAPRSASAAVSLGPALLRRNDPGLCSVMRLPGMTAIPCACLG